MSLRVLVAVACTLAAAAGVRAADATLKWAFYTQGVIYASPAIGADGTVYTGSQSKRLWAINPDGSLKWRFPDTLISSADWFDASPAVGADGTVYAPNFDGTLYAIDASGRLKWTYSIPSYFLSSPAIGADGMIYVGGGDGMVHALRPDGTRLWSYATGDWVDSSPAIATDGTIYVGSWDNAVYALRPDGTLKWRYATGNAIQSSPAIGADGTVYVGSADKSLYALRPDGTLAWSFATGDSVDASPAVGPDGTVYVGSADGRFYAVRPDGTAAWPAPYDAGQGLFGGAVIRGDGSIVFGGSDRAVHVLNPDGSLKWKYQTGDVIDATPAVAPDGTVYVGSYDGKLYAFAGSGAGVAVSAWPRFRADARQQGRVPLGQALVAPTITTAPAAQTVAYGDSVTFSVVAVGTQPFSYQWIKDGADIPGADTAALYLPSVDTAAAGVYQVRVSNAAGSVTSAGAALAVAAPIAPAILVQPRSLTVATGGRLSLWVEASGSLPLLYQWSRDGVDVPGAVDAFFEIDAAAAGDAGTYRVRVTNAGGAAWSEVAALGVASVAPARLVNLSTRASVVGDSVLIPGFFVSGTGSRRLLVRAVGPTLAAFQVSGANPDPQMLVIPSIGAGVANDNWCAAADAGEVAAVSTGLGAFSLPVDSLDAATLVEVFPGSCTVHITGVSGASGVLLVELYDGGQLAPGDAQLINISARGDTGEGDTVMIPGFVIAGDAARTLLVRAVGPSLSRFGVTGFLPDPVLSLFAGTERILTVDNWTHVADVDALVAASQVVSAFTLEDASADAAMLVVLAPGRYTAQASGRGTTSGNVLVEVYAVP
jgi:outer membrane protein assembly factor BamB